MGLVKSILLTVIAIGMVVASSVQPDALIAQAELMFGAGAFALAWVLPSA